MGSLLNQLLQAALSDADREALRKLTGYDLGGQNSPPGSSFQQTGWAPPVPGRQSPPGLPPVPGSQPQFSAQQGTRQGWSQGMPQGQQGTGTTQGMYPTSGSMAGQPYSAEGLFGNEGSWNETGRTLDPVNPEGQGTEGQGSEGQGMEGQSAEGTAYPGTSDFRTGRPGAKKPARPEHAMEDVGETVSPLHLKLDSDSVLQGILWSEVLGKPKALRRR